MARPQITNHVYMEPREMRIGSSLDSYHLMNVLDSFGPNSPTDLGVIDLWLYAKRAESPLYKFADFDGKNTVMVDNPKGEYSWTVPVNGTDFFVVEDIDPTNTRKGENGSSFQIKMNKKAVSHSAVITYDKMNGVELYVTEDDIIETGDGHVIYTVKLRNNGHAKYLDNVYLTPKTKWFRATSDAGEYGQRFDEIMSEAASQVLYNYVGNTNATFQHEISSRAALMMKGGVKSNGAIAVNTIWNVKSDALDPSLRDVRSFEDIRRKLGSDWMKDAQKSGALSMKFVTQLEDAGIQKIIRDNEYDMMWGKGAAVQSGYGETLRSSVGLWQQANAGWAHSYNINSFRLDMFESVLSNFFKDRVEITGPNPTQKVVVQTGRGGMKLVMPSIKAEALGQPGIGYTASDVNAIRQTKSGDPYSLTYGFGFTSFTIPFLANVEFVYNSAFDPIDANDIENPIVNGHRLSSYAFVIFDITDGKSDNIVLLKKAWDNQLRWWYINSKFDYRGQTAGFQSSGGNFGFKVQMEMPKTAIMLKDPTRVLKIVPNNPITGTPLFGTL